MSVTIEKVADHRSKYMGLLLMADEQEDMLKKYMDLGDMFVLYKNNTVVGECIVIEEARGVYELKNIAIDGNYRGQGYGKELIDFVFEYYKSQLQKMYVGTGDSPLTIPFYKKCGFTESHRVKNFFLDNYDHPIIEGGKQLIDMVYLVRKVNK